MSAWVTVLTCIPSSITVTPSEWKAVASWSTTEPISWDASTFWEGASTLIICVRWEWMIASDPVVWSQWYKGWSYLLSILKYKSSCFNLFKIKHSALTSCSLPISIVGPSEWGSMSARTWVAGWWSLRTIVRTSWTVSTCPTSIPAM